jgi:site-specific DNA-methyltransferase (adenine-specific)
VWEVTTGDCRDVMAQFDPGSVPLIVADPPYNIGVNYDGHDDRMTPADYRAWCRSWMEHRQTVIWYERFGTNRTRKFNQCTRHLFWMVKHPERFTFNPDAVKTNSARLREYGDNRAKLDGKILDDLWDIPRVAGTHGWRADGVAHDRQPNPI